MSFLVRNALYVRKLIILSLSTLLYINGVKGSEKLQAVHLEGIIVPI